VAYLFKAGIAEPGETAIARQPLCKHTEITRAIAKQCTHLTMEELLEAVFFVFVRAKATYGEHFATV
jgi:hypothetical protein